MEVLTIRKLRTIRSIWPRTYKSVRINIKWSVQKNILYIFKIILFMKAYKKLLTTRTTYIEIPTRI